MKYRIVRTQALLHPVRTRLPFRYGIAEMSSLPHLFLRLELEREGKTEWGVAADHLPPQWFTKSPANVFAEEVEEMLRSIDSACALAEAASAQPTPFALWRDFYPAQMAWGKKTGRAPLLAGFGASLVERALLDAFCRMEGVPFGEAIRFGALGIDLGFFHPELRGQVPGNFLPPHPLPTLRVRHTVGLSDPLTDDEAVSPPDDGLPVSFEACLRTYGITHLKIKLCGQADTDFARLRRIGKILRATGREDHAFTLDGNEQYRTPDEFRVFWEQFAADPALAEWRRRLIFVEQPIHRDQALGDAVRQSLSAWDAKPPLIIDESDAEVGSLSRALACGYVGTSHKNCKGVFKGVANACRIAQLNAERPEYHLSGEDLTNVGPVALLQDLCVAATLGVPHLERNGHHYFRGLSMFPSTVGDAILAEHGDLYARHPRGFATLTIRDGLVRVGSVLQSGLGTSFLPDPALFIPREEWVSERLDAIPTPVP